MLHHFSSRDAVISGAVFYPLWGDKGQALELGSDVVLLTMQGLAGAELATSIWRARIVRDGQLSDP